MEKKQDALLQNVRIIGIFAHVDAGKTTTSEAILYYTGRIHRLGSVDAGSTQLDWMEQERERGITITSAATACHWKGCRINLIDTPGHIDFTAEVVRSIRVIDGAVILLDGVAGVEPQTSAVWKHADRERLPRLIFINKLDRVGADCGRVLADIHARLTPRAVRLQIPIGQEGSFRGMVNLLERQALVWHEGADDPQAEAVPAALGDDMEAAREALVDAICQTDDALLEQRLAGAEPDVATLQAALRRATIARQLVPVLCGFSRNRIGVQPLLDAIVDYLPAPVDLPPTLGIIPGTGEEIAERPDNPESPFCAAVFKIVTDPHVGHLAWVRVFSGALRAGEHLYNPRANVRERVSRIYRMHANRREQVDGMAASDVVALVGIKSAATGDTLCDPEHPILLEAVLFPQPVIAVALAAASENERDRLRQAVARLCAEDPTLISRHDPETGEQTLSGLGELHLEIAVDRLRTEFGLTPRVSAPQVAYHETIRRPAEVLETYKKQTGGHGHFAEVALRVEPLARGAGVVFENVAAPADFPRDFVRPVELGVLQALEKGILAGYPVTDLRVALFGGRIHEVDSAAADFEIAGSMAVRRAVRQAAPTLIEPLMRIDVNVDEEHIGTIIADLGRRRGQVRTILPRGPQREIVGEVPLAAAHGYATDLRSLTQGRGTFTLEFDRYELVPEALTAEIVQQRVREGKLSER